MATVPPEVMRSYLDAYLVAAFVELFLDGIFTTLITFMFLIIGTSKRKLTSTEYIIYLAVFILYAMAMFRVGSWTHHMRDAFINHTGPTETVYAFLRSPDPQAIGRNTLTVAMTFIADLILVWRVFALWGRNWKVGFLPLLLTLFALAFGIQYIWRATRPAALIDLKRINIDSGIYYGATLANTFVSTVLIIWRIYRIGGTEGIAKYWRALGMVVESAALYSVVLIIYMPFVTGTDFATHASTYVVQSVVIPITGIAPTLLVTRVLLTKEKTANMGNPFMDSIRIMTSSLAFGVPPETGESTTHYRTGETDSLTLNRSEKNQSKPKIPLSTSSVESR